MNAPNKRFGADAQKRRGPLDLQTMAYSPHNESTLSEPGYLLGFASNNAEIFKRIRVRRNRFAQH